MESKPQNLDALRIDRSPIPQNSGRGRFWLLLILLLLLLGGAGAWWIFRSKAISVKTATVSAQSAGSTSSARTLLNASGYVTTRLEATVSSKITGKVAEILVEEGMKVEKDQILARLDDSNVQSSLRLAQAQLTAAQLNLAETAPMVKFTADELGRLSNISTPGALSRSDFEKAEADSSAQAAKLARQKADITVAMRQVEEWEQQLADTIIRAPFAGVVTTKDSQPGEMISPMSSGGFTRTGICTLVDMASLEIEVDVGESFINRVKPKQPVEATLDAYPDWKIPGKVIAIIPTADRQKATVKVRVGFEKLDPRILPQMGVKVAFQSDEPTENTTPTRALTIPKNATQKSNERDIAWVVKDGKVERRAITLGSSNGTEAIVTAGLTMGEVVVLDPPSTLTDSTSVSVENSR